MAASTLTATSRFFGLLHRDAPQAVFSQPRRITTRHILALRAADALALGARQREIAVMLVGPERAADEWRGRSDSLRLATRRLVAGARALQSGGWRALVRQTDRRFRLV
jgi:hypothetical protein